MFKLIETTATGYKFEVITTSDLKQAQAIKDRKERVAKDMGLNIRYDIFKVR